MALKKSNTASAGDVYAVPVSRGYAFGLVCFTNDVAFFNYLSSEAEIPEKLTDLPIAFRVIVDDLAPREGNWIFLDKVSLSPPFSEPGRYLHKPIGSKEVYVYQDDRSYPSTVAEAKDLEIMCAWSAGNIRNRLEDVFENKDNQMVSAMRAHLGL